ncbi:hypothetical protein Pfo_019049 [Paulownia fortunei]|nr:hypothetical protein Pfo_019049 [Paulownia fortunei]
MSLTALGHIVLEPELILDRRLTKKNNRPITQVLIKWFNAPEEEALGRICMNCSRSSLMSVLEDKDYFGGRIVADRKEISEENQSGNKQRTINNKEKDKKSK